MTTSRNQREGRYVGHADRSACRLHRLRTGHIRAQYAPAPLGPLAVETFWVWIVLIDRRARRRLGGRLIRRRIGP